MEPCFECGTPTNYHHHVIPVSRGGAKTIPLCERCHGRAHNMCMNIPALTKDAMTAKKARGEFCGGEVPYGFTVVDGKLVACESEQETIRLAKEFADERKSLATIGDALAERGRFSRNGKVFMPTQIMRLVPERPKSIRKERATDRPRRDYLQLKVSSDIFAAILKEREELQIINAGMTVTLSDAARSLLDRGAKAPL